MVTILYVTFPDATSAKEIAKTLFEQKLIACVNFMSARTLYPWKGKLKEEREQVAFFKTSKPKEAITLIQQMHPYDIPCIESIEAKATPAYEEWVKRTCSE